MHAVYAGASWASWGHVGSILAPTWPDLDAFLGHVKLPWGPCWRILGPCWLLLGHLGPILVPSWAMLSSLWPHVGASLAMLGHVGPILSPTWPSWALVSSLWAHLGPSWVPPGHSWNPVGPLLRVRLAWGGSGRAKWGSCWSVLCS